MRVSPENNVIKPILCIFEMDWSSKFYQDNLNY